MSKATGSHSSLSFKVDLQFDSSSFFPAKYQSTAYLLLAEADLQEKKPVLNLFRGIVFDFKPFILWFR